MDTSALAAQLIGEEPGFCVVLRTAILGRKTKFTFTPAHRIRQLNLRKNAGQKKLTRKNKSMSVQHKKICLASVSLILVVFIVVGIAGGCASTTLPPRLNADEQAMVNKTRMNLTLGVEECKWPAYSDGLVKALGKTHLFARVDHLKNFDRPPDLVAHIENTIYGSATIPILTGLSLGIIPTTVNEDHGYSFSLSRRIDSQRVPIEFKYSGPTTLGWWAVILNLSPNRTMRDVDSHPRFSDGLAWAVISKQPEIESLLKP
jgi:hypothetical protein